MGQDLARVGWDLACCLFFSAQVQVSEQRYWCGESADCLPFYALAVASLSL